MASAKAMAGRHREAAMRSFSGLGAANLALLSVYFAPVWGRDALRALVSPYNGFEDQAHAAAVKFIGKISNFGLDGMVGVSNVLAAVKLVIAAGFVAYAIEFARALATGRRVNRETVTVVLVLAVAGIVIWAVPALTLDDGALVRLHATQLLMVAGALIVILTERHVQRPLPKLTRQATAARKRLETLQAAESLPLQDATARTAMLLARGRETR
jgi:hypothetical protein